MDCINLRKAFDSITEQRKPEVIGTLNGSPVRIAKIQGQFDWHQHKHADEFILVMKGELEVNLRDHKVGISAGECFTVPRGEEHMTLAQGEVEVLYIRPE